MGNKPIEPNDEPVSALIYGIQHKKPGTSAKAGISIGKGVVGGLASMWLPKSTASLLSDGLGQLAELSVKAGGISYEDSTDTQSEPSVKETDSVIIKNSADTINRKPTTSLVSHINDVPPADYDFELKPKKK